jgi:hypothetical protein
LTSNYHPVNVDTITVVSAGADTVDLLERAIRRNFLLGLLSELYVRNPSDVIGTKEWLLEKLGEPAEDEPRCTNNYLCPNEIPTSGYTWLLRELLVGSNSRLHSS